MSWPTPLPQNPFHAAYDQCLTLPSVVEPVEGCPPPIVYAHILGHLLRLAPPGNPQGQLQREIASSSDHATLMKLAAFVSSAHAIKRSSGPTPAPSDHPSRASFGDVRDYSMALMDESKLDHHQAQKWATLRDNNHCVITGEEDYKQPEGRVIVQAAHIIPESTNTNIREPGRKRSHSANVWSILAMFSRDTIIEDLAGNWIHRLENVISMNSTSHQLFDELQPWLKPVEGALHRYRVCTAKGSLRYYPPLPEYVTLTTDTNLPLPNPEYLGLHALCCEVAWMSGLQSTSWMLKGEWMIPKFWQMMARLLAS